MKTEQFAEHDIRPADTATEQKRRYEADVARLLDGSAEFVEVSCPGCSTRGAEVRFRKYSLNYLECGSCGTLYVSPRPTPSQLSRYYQTSENYAYWNSVIFPASEAVRRTRIFQPRVERVLDACNRHGTRTDVLMEIGAGFGTFCEEMRARNAFKRILALEPTPELAATCRARGLEVVEKRVEDLQSPLEADVVVSFEVIEHLFEPREFVNTTAGNFRFDARSA